MLANGITQASLNLTGSPIAGIALIGPPQSLVKRFGEDSLGNLCQELLAGSHQIVSSVELVVLPLVALAPADWVPVVVRFWLDNEGRRRVNGNGDARRIEDGDARRINGP